MPKVKRAAEAVDAEVLGAGSISLVAPRSPAGKRWFKRHLAQDAEVLSWGGAVVVEHRCLDGLVQGMRDGGLQVR